MTAPDQDNYRLLISDLVKKQMIMLGPNLVISKVRNMGGLSIQEDGTVTKISQDPQLILQKLVDYFMELSGNIAKMTLGALLEKYPEVKRPNS